MKIAWIAGALALATGAAGCSGSGSGSGGGSGKTVTINEPGGFIILESAPGITVAAAEFLKSVSPEPGPVSRTFGDGSCEYAAYPGTPDPNPPVETRADAGVSLTFASGASSVVAMETTDAGIAYLAFDSTAIPTDADFTVTNAGGPDIAAGTLATLHMPKPASLTGTPAVTPGQALALTFTAGTGADMISIDVSDANGDVFCYVPDTGSFTVPGDMTSNMAADATVSVGALNMNVVQIGGRDVLVETEAQN